MINSDRDYKEIEELILKVHSYLESIEIQESYHKPLMQPPNSLKENLTAPKTGN